MEDDKFYEIREKLWGLLKEFVTECNEINADAETEVDVILSEVIQDT